MNRWKQLSPPEVSRLAPFLLVLLVLPAAFFLPFDTNTRGTLFLVADLTLVFAAVIHLPFLKGHGTIAASRLGAFANTLMITLALVLLGDKIPLVAAIYLISIAALGIRRGLKYALLTALLSSIGYLSALSIVPGIRLEKTDSAVLVGLFFLIAFLVGSLSEASQRHLRDFENVVTRSREAIMILDRMGTFEFLNPAALTLSGYRADELLGHSFFEFILEADHASARLVWDSLDTQTPINQVFQIRLRRKDNELRILALTLAVHNPDGPRYLVIARDITAQEIERTAHERRHRDLEAERAVASAISETLEIETVLDVALEQALATLRMEAGAIYLADDGQKELTLITARNLSDAFIKPVLLLRFGEGLTGTAAAERQVILVPDLNGDARVIPAQREDTSIRSQASVPLIVQNRVVGVLNVMACETRAFTNEDASLLLTIASSVAVAIDHARLFDSLERRVAERTKELATLNRIARALSTTLKLDDLLEIVYREISAAMDTDAFFVALYDPSTTELDFRIRVDKGIREPVQRRLTSPGLTSYVVTNRRALLIRNFDLEKDHLPPAKTWGTMQAPQSWLGVPMLLGDRLVGVISVQAYRPNAYTQDAQEFLSTIADTVALAVENARLFEETARRAEQLTILREIDRTLSSMLDLKPMLETTLSRLAEIVPYDGAAVLLLDGNILRAAAARGRGDERLKEFTLDISDNSIFLEMDLKRVPIIIDDLKESPLWANVPGLEFARAWLGAPLIARGDMIGQISVFSVAPGSFTREHSDLVHSFANHTAIAIANARMHTELQDQARRDSLTQVLNHGAFITDLHAATERGQALAMIMFDLDNFKRYNDTYGHVVGDAVLKAVVQAIRAHIKKSDFVGRWGGEEFGIALRGANTARAIQIAARIRATLAQTLIRDRLGQPISPPTASQGVSALPETANSVDELIEQADRALYRAKALGRDQVITACDRAIERETQPTV